MDTVHRVSFSSIVKEKVFSIYDPPSFINAGDSVNRVVKGERVKEEKEKGNGVSTDVSVVPLIYMVIALALLFFLVRWKYRSRGQ